MLLSTPIVISGKVGSGEAAAWSARAAELAAWAWRLVNRTDVWGGYRPPQECGKPYTRPDGTTAVLGHVTTRPALRDRGRVCLSPAILAQHFAATSPGHVVGLHTTSPDNTSLWGAVELDRHGDGGNAPEANLAAALFWHDGLARRGFRPLLTDSNGAGGYHLCFLLAGPAATAGVYALLKSLTADFASHGLTAAPETFPKQPRVAPGRFGNWLRLPGRHHTREHWSRVWDGRGWLAGAAAVDSLLAFDGDAPGLVPLAPVPPPRPGPARNARVFRGGGDRLSARIAAYMARLPNLALGQGRDDVAYRFAAWLVRDVGVSDDVALQWLSLWDTGNQPPKGDEALREILANAHKYARGSRGTAGPAPARCPRGRRGPVTYLRFQVRV
jgi:hypothetical protein